MTCSAIWTLSFIGPVLFLSIDMNDLHVNGNRYTCSYAFSSEIWEVLIPITFVLFVLVPTLTVIVTSSILVKHLIHARKMASRSRGDVRWQGIVTVSLTACVFLLSFLPTSVYKVVLSRVDQVMFRLYGPRITDSMLYLHVFANFFIYSRTVASFREFLRSRFELLASFVRSENIMKT